MSPTAPPKPCAWPRCRQLVPAGVRHCDEHRKLDSKAREQNRPNAGDRGYDAAWRRVRLRVLERDGYLCRRVPGCRERATEVDHIKPVSTHPHLRLEETNLVASCRYHNRAAGGAITPRPGGGSKSEAPSA